MANISASCIKLSDIDCFHEAGINTVLFSLAFFSARPSGVFSNEDIKKGHQRCVELNMKSAVVMTRFFIEAELEQAKTEMQVLKDIGIDLIYFTDCCILWIAKELGMLDKLIYNPDTLITNASDAQFYLDQGIAMVTLSKEITKDEMVEIAHQVNGEMEVLIHGRLNMMHSKRNLLSSYFEFIKKPFEYQGSQELYLMEENRDEHMPIIEDDLGTHVFTGFTLCSFMEINELLEAGIRNFRIESLFLDVETICMIAKDYQRVINHEIDGETLYLEYQTKYPNLNITNGYMNQKTSTVKVNL